MTSIEQQKAALSDRLRSHIQDCIANFLKQHQRMFCVELIAEELRLPFRTVDLAIFDLVKDGRVVHAGRDPDGNNTYRAVNIGPCEWCGVVDHRLMAGECSSCASRSINFDPTTKAH